MAKDGSSTTPPANLDNQPVNSIDSTSSTGPSKKISDAVEAVKGAIPEVYRESSIAAAKAIRNSQRKPGGDARFAVFALFGLVLFAAVTTALAPWVPMNPPSIAVVAVVFAVASGILGARANWAQKLLVTGKEVRLKEISQQKKLELRSAEEHRDRQVAAGVPESDANREYLAAANDIEQWFSAELRALREPGTPRPALPSKTRAKKLETSKRPHTDN